MLKEKHDEILKDDNLKKMYKELEYENKKILELDWELSTMYFGVAGVSVSYIDDLRYEISIHLDSYDKIKKQISDYINKYKKKNIKKKD